MSQSENWQPTASIVTLKRRAKLLADVRLFFAERNVLEVETPIMSTAAPTAPYLDSFTTHYLPAGGRATSCYLQTSPEFAMKRLLAAGSGDIYQIAKVFRNGEHGRHHSPEFTMLEWYRPQLDYWQLMQEVNLLLQHVANLPAAELLSYQQVFEQYLQLNPHTETEQALQKLALENISSLPADWHSNRDGWLEMLMSEVIEPQLEQLNKPVIIYDFPASQAQLAKLHQDEQGQSVAARFEVYSHGLELANGYDECTSADELAARFEADNRQRERLGKAIMPIDQNLLEAMQASFPECTGVALGLDRLMMIICSTVFLSEVTSFGF